MTHLVLIIISALLALGFGLYLMTRRGHGLVALSLCGAFAATLAVETFDYLALTRPEDLALWRTRGLLAEAFLPLTWLFYSSRLHRHGGRPLSHWLQWLLVLCAALMVIPALTHPVQDFFYSPDFAVEKILFLRELGVFYYTGILLFMVVALVNLEITLMSAQSVDRWKIKFEILGAGLVIAFFIVYYSQGLLYRSIDMSLAPARAFMLIVGVALMGYSCLKRGGVSDLRLSQTIAYRSVVVFILGLYFIAIALLGEGLRYFGETSHRTFFMIVAFVGCLAMVAAVLSDQVKRKVKVFLHKNFYRTKYDYRQQWLEFTKELSNVESASELYGRVLAFFCATFGFRGAGLYLSDGAERPYEQQAVYERCTLSLSVPAADATLARMRDKEWVVDLASEEDVTLAVESKSCLLVPLASDRRLDGFIVLEGKINPDEELFYEDLDLMKVLARQANAAILNLRLSRELMAAREMELMARVSAFVLHDLKNLVSNLGLVVDNAESYLDDPEFQADMMSTLRGTVTKMKALIQRLKNMQEKASLNRQPANLLQVVESALSTAAAEVAISGDGVSAEIDAEEIQKVVLNLVLNSLEASGGKSAVQVEVGQNGRAFIRVADQGCGMSEEFLRTRLFKPFETTKKKGFGIGLYQCRHIVEAHGGQIEVSSAEGKGSEFTVWLPLEQAPL